VQPPVPSNTISIGRGARLWPPPSGAPSMLTMWPEPVSARKLIPDGPFQLTLTSIRILPSVILGVYSTTYTDST
jgi:hypothetical protein